eukprot:gene26854-29668_t
MPPMVHDPHDGSTSPTVLLAAGRCELCPARGGKVRAVLLAAG